MTDEPIRMTVRDMKSRNTRNIPIPAERELDIRFEDTLYVVAQRLYDHHEVEFTPADWHNVLIRYRAERELERLENKPINRDACGYEAISRVLLHKQNQEAHKKTRARSRAEIDRRRHSEDDDVTDVRRQIANAIRRLRDAKDGTRNNTLNATAYLVGRAVTGGYIEEARAIQLIYEAAHAAGMSDDEIQNTAESGFTAGQRDGWNN